MHHQHEQTGACLCGAVSLRATLTNDQVSACHCSTCLGWGGGPFFATECDGPVQFKGEENITVFDSSEWAERGFCRHCGTHLFYRLKDQQHYAIPFSLFDPRRDWTFSEQVFIESKPEFYSFAESTRKVTGEELFARFPPT